MQMEMTHKIVKPVFVLTMNIFMQWNPFLRLISERCDLADFL